MEVLHEAFLEQMKTILPQDHENFIETLNGEAPVSIRMNPFKETQLDLEFESSVPWTDQGAYLKKRPVFTLDPSFHAGAYYVQEASSMLIEQAIKQLVDLSKPIKALDLCAAPGGKSTLLSSLLNDQSILVSNEVIGSRYKILIENMQKWGQSNQIVTNHDVNDFAHLKGFFDLILVDAPCSGEGLFRKDKKSRSEWSEKNVNLCASRQKRILAEASDLLAPNGILIYSTCTYNKHENELNAAWIEENFNLKSKQIKLDEAWGLSELRYGYQAFPHKCKGEGFYMSVFEADDSRSTSKMKFKSKGKKGIEILNKKESEEANYFLNKPEDYTIYRNHIEELCFFPRSIRKEVEFICQGLYRYNAGSPMGTFKHNKLIPNHAFALSNAIGTSFDRHELSYEQAISFLRKESLPVHDLSKQGWHIMTYKGLNLGWGKVLKDRINNYFPKHLRIRMQAN
jgi:16S rRNA C967 or C1407 C5-methylase (RsmB/RsmF family)/NOL1/NOP2/fmu family ribosome biogenesis protein